MRENKFLYSKCPYCGKHGINVFQKSGKATTYKVQCIYCAKTFKANIFIYIALLLAVVLCFSGLTLLLKYFNVPLNGFANLLLVLLAYYSFNYFLPVKMIDESVASSIKKHINKKKKH